MNIEKQKVFLIRFAFFAVLTFLTVAVLKYAFPLLGPFLIAFIIAFLLQRPIRAISRILRLPQKPVSLVVVLVFYAAVGLALSMLGIRAVSALAALIRSLPGLYDTLLRPSFMSVLNDLEIIFMDMDPALVTVIEDLGSQFILTVGKMISNLSVSVMGIASSFASALPGLFIELVLLLISTLFISMDYEKLSAFCMRQLSDPAREVFLHIKKYVMGTLLVCIRSYLIIMSLTFVELSIGLTIIGVKNAVLIAFCIAIFDILPVLGTGGIMLPWAAIALLQGNYSLALGLILLYVAITVIRNIIEPKIVGGQLGLHPVVTLCSMFVGVQLFGVIGLFGFPIGLSLLRHLNDNGIIKVLK